MTMARRADARALTAVAVVALGLWAVVGGLDLVRLSIARTAARDDAATVMDALHRRHDRLTQLLATRPMAAQNWVSLAAVRHALGMAPDGVDGALLMSSLTGPNEADVMAQRALFGLAVWETSAAEIHARVLTDLCGVTVNDPSRLRLVLSTKPEAVRAAIRAGMIDHGCAGWTIAAVGL